MYDDRFARVVPAALASLFVLLTAMTSAPAVPAGSAWQVGAPIVTYWAGPEMTEATARQMAEGHFNVVWCGRSQLDTVQAQGLRAMLHDGLLNPATLTDPAKRAELDALIAAVKDHPAMYAYFIGDEPNAARFPEIGKLFAYLREKDPKHLAYINLFPTYASNEQLGNKGDVITAYTDHLNQYVDTVKPGLISYDHYHYGVGGDGAQYFLNLGLIRKAALQARVPFLNIVQACTWSPGMRIPHTNEVRWLVNTSLAYGAQGISYYVYCYPGHLGALATPDGQPTPLYYGLRRVNRDFTAMAAELQPLCSLGAYHVGDASEGTAALPAGAPLAVAPAGGAGKALIGYFGRTGACPTHFVIMNLDYAKPVELALTAPGDLVQFNPARRHWAAAPLPGQSLRLPPAGAVLLRLKG